MALTIRTMSAEAEKALLEIQNANENINTSTKAIEFVLENYLAKCEALKQEQDNAFKLRVELMEAQDKLRTIANGFNVISEMIAK